MAKLLKLRRGNTSQHGSFAGAEGEVTVDTDKKTLVAHDGSTNGGFPLLRQDLSNLPAGTIDNADVNSSAAIAGTKIAPDFGSQNIITTGEVRANGNVAISNGSPTIYLTDTGHNPDYMIRNADGGLIFNDTTNSANRLVINTDGHVDVTGNLDVGAGVDVTGNITVSGTVDGVDIATRNTLFGGLTSSSGVLSNGVTATTQGTSDNTTKVATTAYVTTAIGNADAFPSGTVMLFAQTSAPTGWTKSTSHNNKALRVVSGTSGSGGSNAFTTAFASRGITSNAGNTTQGGNISVSLGNTTAGGNVSVANATQGGNVSVSIANATTGGTVDSHTLTTSQLPSHSHSGGFSPVTATVTQQNNNNGQKGNQTSTGNTGGGQGHSHGFTGGSHNHNANASFSGSAHSHNASFSGTAHNHNASGNFSGSAHNHSISVNNLDLAVQYVDIILATKD